MAVPPTQKEPAAHATYAFPFQYWPAGALLVVTTGHELLPEREVEPVGQA